MCKKKETFIKKTVGDIIGFKSRMNQHISKSNTGVLTCKFSMHTCKFGLKNKC